MSATTFRTTITLNAETHAAATEACDEKNENRDFSNLCEVALNEWLTAHGYLKNGIALKRRPEFLAKLSRAMADAPELEKEIEGLIKKSTRKVRLTAA